MTVTARTPDRPAAGSPPPSPRPDPPAEPESPLTAYPRRVVPRPVLLPGLRRLWRGRHSLQLGTDPARAVVLELPDAAAAGLLDLLDGTRSEAAAVAEAAARYRIDQTDARALLADLHAAGLVVGAHTLLPRDLAEPVRNRLTGEAAALALCGTDAPPAPRRAGPPTPAQVLRRRAAARVVVDGAGQLVEPVALALARAGVGQVATPGWPAVAETVHRLAPGTRTGTPRRRDISFLVLPGETGPAVLAAAGYAGRRLPHLAVAVRDGTPVVGPLVPPAGCPCLRCLDLHRQERDPHWPRVAAQLAAAGPALEPCAVTTLLAAVALAAAEVLTWLDGRTPETLGASIEVEAAGRLRRRTWPAHPGCPDRSRGRRRPAGPPARAQSGDG